MAPPDRAVRARAPELARRLPRVLVGLALALPVLLVVGVLLASQLLQRQTPDGPGAARVTLPDDPAPAAAGADCARLLSGLPQEIRTSDGLLPRRLLTEPTPGTVAWGGTEDADGRTVTPPLVLRCGLSRPPELGPTAALLDVDGVEWVERPGAPGGGSTWITADRAVYVGLTLPAGAGSAAIQDVSRGVKITLASRAPG